MDMLLESWSASPRPSAQILIRAEPWNLTSMTIPHYVNEDKSDMRGIKPGWYAMGDDGSLVAGPFDTSEKCVGPTRQKADRQLHALLVGTDDRFFESGSGLLWTCPGFVEG